MTQFTFTVDQNPENRLRAFSDFGAKIARRRDFERSNLLSRLELHLKDVQREHGAAPAQIARVRIKKL